MNKYNKITIFFTIFLFAIAGFFVYSAINRVSAASCFFPFQRIDLDEIYNGSVCQETFQVYYFPVTSDGRSYTITLRSLEGEQKLYASRYKNEVDELSDLQSWFCNDDHCDSSVQINANTKIVNFRAPVGDPDYYSWFAVYGINAGKFQIGVSDNGVLQFATGENNNSAVITAPSNTPPADTPEVPSIVWKTGATISDYNFSNIGWTAIDYNDGSWSDISMPDKNSWNCEKCYREYRGTFNLDSVPNNLKMSFVSDDGLRIYVNGQIVGSWGAKDRDGVGCVNNYGCIIMAEIGDVVLNNLVKGKNVISVLVINGAQGGYFDFKLKK
jgi:hypothetical protein